MLLEKWLIYGGLLFLVTMAVAVPLIIYQEKKRAKNGELTPEEMLDHTPVVMTFHARVVDKRKRKVIVNEKSGVYRIDYVIFFMDDEQNVYQLKTIEPIFKCFEQHQVGSVTMSDDTIVSFELDEETRDEANSN
jgi:hypothetical protein